MSVVLCLLGVILARAKFVSVSPEEFHTPGRKTIAEVAEFTGLIAEYESKGSKGEVVAFVVMESPARAKNNRLAHLLSPSR